MPATETSAIALAQTFEYRKSVGPPFTIQVELTSVCNLHCAVCPVSDPSTPTGTTPKHMSESIWNRVRAAAIDSGEVTISGFGEPLLDPHFLDRLQELDAHGVRVSFSTNGQAVTPKLAASLARLEVLGGINVSIDAPDPKLYWEMRGGHLAKALRGLANLVAHLPDPDRLSVSSIVTRRNIESLLGVPELLARIGVRKWVVQSLNSWVSGSEDQHLLDGGISPDLFARLESNCDKTGIALCPTQRNRLKLELAAPEEARRRYFAPVAAASGFTRQCTVPWELPYVDHLGRVFPCCIPWPDEPMGNLADEPLNEIWTGKRFTKFRHDLMTGDPLPERCRSCTAAQAGPHPLLFYSARIVGVRPLLDSASRVLVEAENTGLATWKRGCLSIGTAKPRDRASGLRHPSWPSPTRAGSFSESWVRPGQTATFEVELTSNATGDPESFQLVAEGVTWLPDTEFEIGPFHESLDKPSSGRGRYRTSFWSRLLRRQTSHR